MRRAPVGEEGQLLHLLVGRLGVLLAAVAGVDAEQGGQAVEVALAVVVEDVAALAAGDDRDLTIGERGHLREVQPQMAAGQRVEVTLRVVVRVHRRLYSHRRHVSPCSSRTPNRRRPFAEVDNLAGRVVRRKGRDGRCRTAVDGSRVPAP